MRVKLRGRQVGHGLLRITIRKSGLSLFDNTLVGLPETSQGCDYITDRRTDGHEDTKEVQIADGNGRPELDHRKDSYGETADPLVTFGKVWLADKDENVPDEPKEWGGRPEGNFPQNASENNLKHFSRKTLQIFNQSYF